MVDKDYKSEFDLLSVKYATKMSDMTQVEIELWKQWLVKDLGSYVLKGSEDLFDSKNGWEGYNEEIQIRYWLWSHDDKSDILLDMNAWPGDNEGGAIFLNQIMVFKNGDQDISSVETTPENLKLRLNSFEHLRNFYCQDEIEKKDLQSEHIHCQKVYEKYHKLLGERAYITISYEIVHQFMMSGQLKIWKVSEFQPANPSNVKMLFGHNLNSGYEYISEVYYDSTNQKIFYPL